MKKTIQIVKLFLFLGILLQCNDVDENITSNLTPPNKERFQKLFDDGEESEVQSAHFQASNPNFVFTSSRGTKITINGTCLRLNGAPVTGTVIMNMIELYENERMAVANKPTMGLKANGEKEALLSGGAFFITVKKDGQTLTTTCPVKIEAPVSNTGGAVSGMQAFNGVITDKELTWEPTTSWDVLPPNAQSNNYTMNVPGFGWYNCDKFYNYPEPKTTITANVPSGYGNVSRVFIITKNVPNSLGSIAGKYPIGLNCYLLFVSESNGKYVFMSKLQTLTANHTVTFDLKDAQVGNRSDYVGHVTLLR